MAFLGRFTHAQSTAGRIAACAAGQAIGRSATAPRAMKKDALSTIAPAQSRILKISSAVPNATSSGVTDMDEELKELRALLNGGQE
jgi:hypothetical protein